MYDRHHPFAASIVSRHCISGTEATRETWHFVLDISGSGIQYQPGDSIGIFPHNDTEKVEAILRHLGCSGDEVVGHTHLRDYLLKKVNFTTPTKKLLTALSHPILEAGDEALKHYVETHDVEETLRGTRLPYEVFIAQMSPLLPRFYSIASSQPVVGDEIHLTVARLFYHVNGKERRGICSHFLCDQARLHEKEISIFLQPTKDFRLPADNTAPIIMIGPGTGVAPFRAFMQERVHRGANPKTSWLFFGERHQKSDFFYEEYWKQLSDNQLLKIDTAFSRDQAHKVYVQDRMWEKKEELWQWLQSGATLYVCGDASHMAKDVEAMLLKIAEAEGKMSFDQARQYIKELRLSKRYLRDVY
jgi:sulfite reductase (NADPH) flavoprotein alpha-component